MTAGLRSEFVGRVRLGGVYTRMCMCSCVCGGVDHSLVPGTEVGLGKCPMNSAMGREEPTRGRIRTDRQTGQDRGDSGGHNMAQTMVASSRAPRRKRDKD